MRRAASLPTFHLGNCRFPSLVNDLGLRDEFALLATRHDDFTISLISLFAFRVDSESIKYPAYLETKSSNKHIRLRRYNVFTIYIIGPRA